MHTYVRRALQTALVSGGLLAAGAVAAHATPHDGVLGVDVVVGSTTETLVALSLDVGGEPQTAAGGAPLVSAPVGVPVDVSDVAVAVLGDATVTSSDPDGGAGVAGEGGDPSGPEAPVPSPGGLVSAPLDVPVDVSDVAVAVLGDATVVGAGSSAGPTDGDAAGSAGQEPAVVSLPVTAPVEVSGVAVGVLGDADVTQGPVDAGSGVGPAEPVGSGAMGAGEEPLVVAPVTVPVTVSGVAVGVLGDATVARKADGATGGSDADGGTPGTPGTPGTSATPGAPGGGSGGGSGVGSPAPGVVIPSDGVLGAGGQAPGEPSGESGSGFTVGLAGGGGVGADPAAVAGAEPVALARASAGVRPSDAALAARAAEVPPVAVLASTGSELWLVPVALALVVGGVWLRGRAHRAAAHHPGRVTFVPHQRGASDGS
ncbi:hypothetical protein [Cellulomonas sp. NS3]|uniref:hypothetical protein n=1 Tax=Cellulomonas sp. NS3 TaxID=2973977 RepID=UPI002163B568|nr:hypothetical protein [Cellulomonas sp. NS3]